jgi:DNA polymerase-3 subunit delta'
VTWQSMLEDLEKSDVGEMQQWLDKHIKEIPHDLIANVVLSTAHEAMLKMSTWEQLNATYDALLSVASWPKEVVRHTLRPAPALLSCILQLRSALKIRV